MKHWIATFGYGQRHPLTGADLADHYTRVPADTHDQAHELMLRSVFGQHFCALYEHADGPRSAGVKLYGLHEVPWVPPSPISDAVWAAYEQLGNAREDLWVRHVSQPVEVAWHRAQTAAAALTPDALPDAPLSPALIAELEAEIEKLRASLSETEALIAERDMWEEHARIAHRLLDEARETLKDAYGWAVGVCAEHGIAFGRDDLDHRLGAIWNHLKSITDEVAAADDASTATNDRRSLTEKIDDRPPVITLNDFGVGIRGDGMVTLIMPPLRPITRDEALRLAAWIVTLADPAGDDFTRTLQAVRST